MAYTFSDTALFVSEGDYVQFRFRAPAVWDFTETVTITIGDSINLWLITVIPEDFTPDPFPFQKIVDAEPETLYTYGDGTRPGEQVVVVSGLTPTTQAPVFLGSNIGGDINSFAMRIDYNGDGTWDTDWIQGNGTESVENGARIQIRGKTQSFANQTTKITLVIGTSNEVWSITTKPIPLNIPDPFPNFTDLVGEPQNTVVYSEVIRVQGLTSSAIIQVSGGGAEWAVSSANNTEPDATGKYEVLTGATFSSASGTINNTDYLQLRMTSASDENFPVTTFLTIGDGDSLSSWSIITGSNPSTIPNSFSFPDKSDVIEDALIASESRPPEGISGLGIDPDTGESISVPVELVSTTSTEVKIKINDQSIGVFPATVKNGDKITLYMRSSTEFSQPTEMTIKVGDLQIPTWTIETSSGPDYDAVFTPPADKVGQVPGTFISSSPITITSINRPITIEVIDGYDALISIDYDEPIAGPRVFDPAVNTSFYLVVLSADQLGTPEFTQVVVGTEADNVSAVTFTWNITTYAVAPPPAANLGVWYSKKTSKFDGYSIGTICSILKENVVVGYGNLSGELGSRYPGFIECDGRSLDASTYWALWEVIGNTYGGNATKTFVDLLDDQNNVVGTTTVYSGSFNIPDYRNRRLCGVGFVDSSRGNSAFLPVSTPGKGIFDVGAEGGYWYFDKVDTAGSNPLEQIEGTGTEGLDSQFFSLGTVRLEGLETITDDVNFTITGSVTAQVGPLSIVTVPVPDHNHMYISAVVEGDGGDPLIPFNNSPGTSPRALLGTGVTGEKGPYNKPIAQGGDPQAYIISEWEIFINEFIPNFDAEISRYDPNYTNLAQWIEDNLGTAQTPDNGTSYSSTTGSYLVWWPSPDSELTGVTLQTAGSTGLPNGACIDTEPSLFTIDSYVPSGGTTNGHSHKITLDPVGNPQTDFTGGNTSNSGIIGGGFGSGLANGSDSMQVTFNQNDIFMDMTQGQFQFNKSIKSPFPDVAMRPQRQVPIINPFHKTKYIIKAY